MDKNISTTEIKIVKILQKHSLQKFLSEKEMIKLKKELIELCKAEWIQGTDFSYRIFSKAKFYEK